MSDSLNQTILAAHEAADGEQLAQLYWQAACTYDTQGDVDRACYFYTYAYVFALESGLEIAQQCHKILKAYGREE